MVIISGLVGVKFQQISKLMNLGKQAAKLGPPPESVGTTVAQSDTWEATLAAVGSVVAAKGVAVSNESPGTVKAIHFESGALVRAGQLLVELDTSVERAQRASAQARKELAVLSEGRSRRLVQGAAVARSQLDGDEAQVKTSRADLSALQAQIDRKTVRAPFAGRLGIRAVNLGQYLNPGTTLTTLEQLGLVYVDFTVPQQSLADVATGTAVRISLTGSGGGTFAGAIAAVDPSVDANTRTIRLRASVPNPDEKLRPGMFVNVAVILPQRRPVVSIPATALVHASYGDSVFVVEDKKDRDGSAVRQSDGSPARMVRQQFVRTGAARGDFLAIADGVKVGQELVTSGAFKLRNGMPVIVRNDIRPEVSLTPTPGNR
jgi:membrane fusion protein (multidrug efflux system)